MIREFLSMLTVREMAHSRFKPLAERQLDAELAERKANRAVYAAVQGKR